MDITIHNRDNESIIISLPERLEDVSLSSALSFSDIEKQLYNVAQEEPFDKIKYLLLMNQAVAEFMDIDVEWLYCLPIGNLEGYIRGLKEVDYKEVKTNVVYLFDRILDVLSGLKPDLYIDRDFEFIHKDIKYKIPSFIKDHLTGGMINPKLSVREVVEALEVRRLYGSMKDDKNSIYTEIVKLTAILARKEGDSFPIEQDEINTFISKRVEIFMDMDAHVGLNVAFFLSNIIVI